MIDIEFCFKFLLCLKLKRNLKEDSIKVEFQFLVYLEVIQGKVDTMYIAKEKLEMRVIMTQIIRELLFHCHQDVQKII